MDVERRAGAVETPGEIEPHEARRGDPAKPGADAALQRIAEGVEGVSHVEERREPPARQEAVIRFEAPDEEVGTADHVIQLVPGTLAVVSVASHARRAAREVAERRGKLAELGGARRADLDPRDPPVHAGKAMDQLSLDARLGEGDIRHDAFGRTAHVERHAVAIPGEELVIGARPAPSPFWDEGADGAVIDAYGELLAPVIEGRNDAPPAEQAAQATAPVLDLAVGGLRGDVQVARGKRGHVGPRI